MKLSDLTWTGVRRLVEFDWYRKILEGADFGTEEVLLFIRATMLSGVMRWKVLVWEL